MGWLEPVSTAVTAVGLANELIKSSIAIKRHAAKLLWWFRHGSIVLPVFGAGGVGKTTAGRILTGDSPLDISTPYDESLSTEEKKLNGNIPGSLLIAPGQIERTGRHWPELFQKMNDHSCKGLINIVCYGYHSFMLHSYKEHDLYEKNMTTEAFMSAYSSARREIELQLMEKIREGLSGISRPFWMVTIVNKQDLWWKERTAVKKYYLGAYSRSLEAIKDALGERNFQHEFIPASLTTGNITTPTGEELALTASGYDQAIHLRHLQMLFDKIYDLIAGGID